MDANDVTLALVLLADLILSVWAVVTVYGRGLEVGGRAGYERGWKDAKARKPRK